MKKLHTLFATLIFAGLMAPVFADEIGPGHPNYRDSTTTLQTTTSADAEEPAPTTEDVEETSLLDYILSLFE